MSAKEKALKLRLETVLAKMDGAAPSESLDRAKLLTQELLPQFATFADSELDMVAFLISEAEVCLGIKASE